MVFGGLLPSEISPVGEVPWCPRISTGADGRKGKKGPKATQGGPSHIPAELVSRFPPEPSTMFLNDDDGGMHCCV